MRTRWSKFPRSPSFVAAQLAQGTPRVDFAPAITPRPRAMVAGAIAEPTLFRPAIMGRLVIQKQTRTLADVLERRRNFTRPTNPYMAGAARDARAALMAEQFAGTIPKAIPAEVRELSSGITGARIKDVNPARAVDVRLNAAELQGAQGDPVKIRNLILRRL